jgi:hypothetical protein
MRWLRRFMALPVAFANPTGQAWCQPGQCSSGGDCGTGCVGPRTAHPAGRAGENRRRRDPSRVTRYDPATPAGVAVQCRYCPGLPMAGGCCDQMVLLRESDSSLGAPGCTIRHFENASCFGRIRLDRVFDGRLLLDRYAAELSVPLRTSTPHAAADSGHAGR